MRLTFRLLFASALLCVPVQAQQVLQSWAPAAGELPRAIATAGDVDGDGLEDLALVEANPALASSRLRVLSLASPAALLDIIGVPDVPDVGSALLALALWPHYGRITLAVLFALYALGAALVFRKLMAEMSAAPPVLSATLRELSNDRDALLARTGRQAGDGGEA